MFSFKSTFIAYWISNVLLFYSYLSVGNIVSASSMIFYGVSKLWGIMKYYDVSKIDDLLVYPIFYYLSDIVPLSISFKITLINGFKKSFHDIYPSKALYFLK